MKINNNKTEGQEKIRDFVAGLVERAKVPEEKRADEQERLEELVYKAMFSEILSSLPDEDLDEIEKMIDEDGDISPEKLYSMMFIARIKPESITGKVLKDVERDYLGFEGEDVDDEGLGEELNEEKEEEQ